MKPIIQKAIDAIKAKKYDLATGLLEAVMELGPDYIPQKSIVPDLGPSNLPDRPYVVTAQNKPADDALDSMGFGGAVETPRLNVPAPLPEGAAPKKVRNIIPPGLASMMMGPDHPDFESKGHKERRIA